MTSLVNRCKRITRNDAIFYWMRQNKTFNSNWDSIRSLLHFCNTKPGLFGYIRSRPLDTFNCSQRCYTSKNNMSLAVFHTYNSPVQSCLSCCIRDYFWKKNSNFSQKYFSGKFGKTSENWKIIFPKIVTVLYRVYILYSSTYIPCA